MKKVTGILVVLLLATIIGCSSSPIDVVKNGVFEFDKTRVVGSALEEYEWFSSSDWVTVPTETGVQIVQVVAAVKQDKLVNPRVVSCLVSFRFHVDGNKFELTKM
ncbi:unnamed protein product, partial [marine sediment metagenome]